jgi:glycerol kinase
VSRSGTNAPLVLAIDQGTTNTKALVVRADGRVLTIHSERVGIEFPRPGWAQSDAGDIWTGVERVVRRCLDDLTSGIVVAIGVANQRESVVAWDRVTGEPVGPLVSWQCVRGADLSARLASRVTRELVRARTGLALDPMFSASKMRWLLDQIPDGPARAASGAVCLGTVDSWLLWNLSGGVFATDLTNASRTMLFDIDTLDWSPELLHLFGVPRAALAEIRPSAAMFGPCTIHHPRLSPDAIVGSLIGDSHAALVGHGAFSPGSVKASFGTGTSVMAPVERVLRSEGLSSTIAWSAAGSSVGERLVVSAVEGNIYATGAALEWVALLLGLDGDVGRLDALARTCDNAGGVSFVPAFAGLGAPHWDPEARGTITGLTRHSGPAEMARAAFEAVGHQVTDVVEEVERALGRRVGALHVDGGAMRSDLLAGIVADLAGVPLLRSEEPELAAVGAARLAGLAAGVWAGIDALRALPSPVVHIDPTMSDRARDHARSTWRSAVDRTRTRVR